MRQSIIASVLLHIGVVFISVLGLPFIQRTPAKEPIPVVVELVSVSTETNLPRQNETMIKKEKKSYNLPKKKTKVPPKKEAKKIAKTLASPQEAKPQKKEIKKMKNEKKIIAPSLKKKFRNVRPRRKPAAPDPFASVLKNLAKFKEKSHVVKKGEKKSSKKKEEFENISRLLTQRRISDSALNKITMTETHAMINTIRKAIMPCWNLQPGAKGAQEIIVVVQASLTPDGRVSSARVVNRNELIGDPFKIAAAETARRAILNQACQPFKLDPRKYNVWRDITLNFNPIEMF